MQLLDVFESPEEVAVVMECISGGQLFERVIELGCYSEQDAFTVLHRLVSTLDFLHCLGLIHRDLKPENILLMGESNTDIRLIDFGVSNTTGDDGMCQSQCGTLIYMAPEMMSGGGRSGISRSYDEKSDLWACGILLFVMLSGAIPFFCEDDEEFFEIVSHPDETLEFHEDEWGEVSDAAVEMVRQILVANPAARPGAAELLLMPMIARCAPENGAIIDRRRWPAESLARAKEEAHQLKIGGLWTPPGAGEGGGDGGAELAASLEPLRI